MPGCCGSWIGFMLMLVSAAVSFFIFLALLMESFMSVVFSLEETRQSPSQIMVISLFTVWIGACYIAAELCGMVLVYRHGFEYFLM